MDSVTVKIRIIIAIALTIAIYPVLDWPLLTQLVATADRNFSSGLYSELSWDYSYK